MSYLKPFPRIVHHGIKDNSRRPLLIEPERISQHLPLVFLLTEKDDEVSIASGSYLVERYGSAMMNPSSPFFTHQSVIAQTVFDTGNQVMVCPIKMPDAKKASLRLCAELIPFTHIDEATGVKTHKQRLVWSTEVIPSGDGANSFSKGQIDAAYRLGTQTNKLGNKRLGVLLDDTGGEYVMSSIKLPILDIQADSAGSYGNNVGISISAPLRSDPLPTDEGLSARLHSFIYRFSLVNRNHNGLTATRVPNKYAEDATDFVLTPNAVDTRTSLEVSFGSIITKMYEKGDPNTGTTVLSPLNNTALYQDNIEVLLNMLARDQEVTAEPLNGGEFKTFIIPGVYSNSKEADKNLYNINIFTGRDFYSTKPYSSFDVDDSYSFGGVSFGRDSTLFCDGGTDGFPLTKAGTLDELKRVQIFDEAVRDWCDNFNEYSPYFDSARYPFSTLYDSGFSIETKKSLIKPIGKHHRIYTILSTQSIADYNDSRLPANERKFEWQQPNTAAQEVAIATMLNQAFHLYPESELYGTETCRGVIVGRCGYLRNDSYKGFLPLTISIANKLSAYCGSGDGYWKSGKAIDNEYNRIEHMFKNINISYQPSSQYDASWSQGMIWVQNFDRNSVFFPAYQTVYSDSSSVLDGLLTIVAASYIQRVGERVWRELTGNGIYGKMKFLEVSDSKIRKYTNDRFDSRITVVPETRYTAADEQRGYSWTTIVRLYADTNKLVNQFSIEAYRRDDLNITEV